MKTVGFIFARGGSKGLPGKNYRDFGGKPLIAWAIEQAKSVDRIARVIVSTDSEEIANVARQYGAEVPFIRPAELAEDESPEWLAWRHALNYLHNSTGVIPDNFVSIPTTAPLRSVDDIQNCLDEYEKGGADAIITVTESHRNPYFNIVKRNEDGSVDLVNPNGLGFSRRQDAPLTYDVTTVCYVLNSKFVLSKDRIFEGQVRAITVPAERAIDIDTLLDFQIAEYLWKKREGIL